jgi:uncharacterized protein YndB with AHSA1/START domain
MGTLPRRGQVEVTTDAPPDAVWAVVGDVTRVGEWSHECGGAEWVGADTTARPGARFRGRNRVGRTKWSRVNEIVTVDPPRSIAWRTVPSALYPDSTRWTIQVEPAGKGSRIVQSFEVLKLNPFFDRLFYLLVPQHRDRSAALLGDLRQIGEVALRTAPDRSPADGAP